MTIRVKICGVTNEADARQAAALGADAVGINFFPHSKRGVTNEEARAILGALPPFVEPVGVFVNQPLRDIAFAINPLGRLRTIQWHGAMREIADPFPFRLISAFPVNDAASVRAISEYLELCRGLKGMPDALLVDAHVPGQYGGTGQTAPWRLLADFRPGIPVILAGGLTQDNVAEAIRIVRPFAVDVASGVEANPRSKDVEKMRRFLDQARNAAAAL